MEEACVGLMRVCEYDIVGLRYELLWLWTLFLFVSLN